MIYEIWKRLFGYKYKAEAVALGLMCMTLAAVFIVGMLALHDARIIRQFEENRKLQEAARVLEAERQANLHSDKRRTQNERDQESLHNVQIEARERDLEGAALAAGPVSNAVAAELRRQQADRGITN